MLVSITAENFFSFGRPTTIELNPDINLLVGINGSGKSNLIKAIRFLSESIVGNGMEKLLLREWGGFQNVANFSGGLKDSFTLTFVFDSDAIDRLLGGKGYRFGFNPVYRVTVFKLGETGYYLEETLSVPGIGYDSNFIFLNMINGKGKISTRENDKVGIQRYPQEDKGLTFKSTELVLSQVSDPDRFYPLHTLKLAIGKMMVYDYFDTSSKSALRKPAPYTTEQLLSPDGTNLVSILNRIKNHHSLEYNKVEEHLKKVNPKFVDIGFDLFGSDMLLMLREQRFAKAVSMKHISDGTLRYLLLLSIMFNPDRGGVLCLDEPEIGLHPDMLSSIVEAFRFASQNGTQLILATHSPLLLNSLDLQHVLVFEKDKENQTIVSRKSEKDIIEWNENVLAGQLWLQGQLGGTRW